MKVAGEEHQFVNSEETEQFMRVVNDKSQFHAFMRAKYGQEVLEQGYSLVLEADRQSSQNIPDILQALQAGIGALIADENER